MTPEIVMIYGIFVFAIGLALRVERLRRQVERLSQTQSNMGEKREEG